MTYLHTHVANERKIILFRRASKSLHSSVLYLVSSRCAVNDMILLFFRNQLMIVRTQFNCKVLISLEKPNDWRVERSGDFHERRGLELFCRLIAQMTRAVLGSQGKEVKFSLDNLLLHIPNQDLRRRYMKIHHMNI